MSKTSAVHRSFVAVKHKNHSYRLYCADIKKAYKTIIRKTPKIPKYEQESDDLYFSELSHSDKQLEETIWPIVDFYICSIFETLSPSSFNHPLKYFFTSFKKYKA